MTINSTQMVDHLFRHHYGKMVATLTRLFGLGNIELIEDVVQDTFIKALSHWKQSYPENPEGWLTAAAKNRAIDLFRKRKADLERGNGLATSLSEDAIDQVFLDYQIEDSQLRMIFTACHPALDPRDQIAFSLKTIAGFSDREIATSLLLKLDTVKKRLSRARKVIKEEEISFTIPDSKESKKRLSHVHRVLYLIFNEGYHSTRSDIIIRSELCSEAMRLISIVLKKHHLRTGEGYALLGLFALNAARLSSKLDANNLLIDLKHQDRTTWDHELITLGNAAMTKAVAYEEISEYHLEAAIAAEHINAKSYTETNWNKIYNFYQRLYAKNIDDYSKMNMAFILLQLKKTSEALSYLKDVDQGSLGTRLYLYYGILSEYHLLMNDNTAAIAALEKAITNSTNDAEQAYLKNKLLSITTAQ